MAKREWKVKTVLVSWVEGKRVELLWDELPPEECEKISLEFTDCFMAAAGFERENNNEK